MHQVTIHATITDSTPQAVAAIIGTAHDNPPATTGPAHPHFSDYQPLYSGLSTQIMEGRFWGWCGWGGRD